MAASSIKKSDTNKENQLNNISSCEVNNFIRLTNKNVLRSCTNLEKNMVVGQQLKPLDRQPIKKQIRFDLGNGRVVNELDETVTPPPKEFKRSNGQRKTIRSARCMSTIVTEKERALLAKKQVTRSNERLNSPKPPAGIVQSMCRFYQDSFGSSGNSNNNNINNNNKRAANSFLKRSNSFNAAVAVIIDHADHEPDSSASSSPMSLASSASPDNSLEKKLGSSTLEGEDEDRSSKRKNGSFRLFRSRSWSLKSRRRSKDLQDADTRVPPPESSSPSYSTRSQDSGFSDSAESNNGCKQPKIVLSSRDGHREQQDNAKNRLKEEEEEEEDPDLTQLPTGAAEEEQQLIYRYENVGQDRRRETTQQGLLIEKKSFSMAGRAQKQDVHDSKSAKSKVNESLGNIASMQEGLRLKRQFSEECTDIYDVGRCCDGSHNKSTPNLLKVGHDDDFGASEEGLDKATKQFYFGHVKQHYNTTQNKKAALVYENNDLSKLSEFEIEDGRPPAMFSTPVRSSFRHRRAVAQAKTPSKVEARMRLKEIKQRRWSNVELEELKKQQHQEQEEGEECDKLGINGSCHCDPDVKERSELPSGIDPSMVAVWSQFLDYEVSEVSLTKFSSVRLSNSKLYEDDDPTSLSLMPSYAVDGTETRLLVESFNEKLDKQQQQPILHDQLSDTHFMGVRSSPGQESRCSTSSSNASHLLNTSPVEEWWRDLHAWCEPECMTYLQSKPIMEKALITSPEQSKTEQVSVVEATARTVEVVRRLQRGMRAVHLSFNAINNHFSAMNLVQLGQCLQTLTSQVSEFILEYNGNSLTKENQKEKVSDLPGLRPKKGTEMLFKAMSDESPKDIMLLQQRAVLQVVDRLKLCAHRCQYTPQQPLAELKSILSTLDRAFNKLSDLMLTSELRVLISEVERPRKEATLRNSLNTIILLGNEGSNHLCALLARGGGVRALIRLCQPQASGSPKSWRDEIRVLALRGLSSVCCVAECIREFEQCGGLNVLDTLLNTRRSSVEDRIESAGVLAQITSPWIADNHRIKDLDAHVPSMVSALTGLARLNGSEETFLLVTAALANLTFMSPLTTAALRQCNTVQTLVRAVKASPFTTLFAKDQVVTVMANMAASVSCRADLRAVDGVTFLISMLHTKADHRNLNQAELAASERVQKKAAIALSRLCNDPQVCYDVIRLGGADRLVDLCKDSSERNCSDAVLVACLAVLRRLGANLEDAEKVFERLDASALVQPKLVDSFLEYSAKQESYV